MAFLGKRILLGVSGGIAAYKAAELARRLIGCVDSDFGPGGFFQGLVSIHVVEMAVGVDNQF